MKRQFLVPAAVALALHAFLLFGFRRGSAVLAEPEAGDLADVKAKAKETFEVQWKDARDEANPAAAPLGNPEAAKPELPDPPVRDPISAITIPANLPNPRPPDHPVTTLAGPWGNRDGSSTLGPGDGPTVPANFLDNPPRTRTQLAPAYPYAARVDGRPGEVLVEFVVDETGRVLDPQVLRSSDPVFDGPTLRAVAKWRFEPGRKNGRVVRFRMAVPVAFALNP